MRAGILSGWQDRRDVSGNLHILRRNGISQWDSNKADQRDRYSTGAMTDPSRCPTLQCWMQTWVRSDQQLGRVDGLPGSGPKVPMCDCHLDSSQPEQSPMIDTSETVSASASPMIGSPFVNAHTSMTQRPPESPIPMLTEERSLL